MELEPDERKNELLKKNALHKTELHHEVEAVSERTEQILTNALVIGGALLATYILFKQFSKEEKKQKNKSRTAEIKLVNATSTEGGAVAAAPEPPGIISQIGGALVSQASVVLLSFAKEKLVEFLKEQATKKLK